jgi:CheY-like chemotaxis protein
MITGNAELALEDIPPWNPVHEHLKEIKAAGLRAAGIVKQLLSFSRRTDQQLKPIGAVTVINGALKFLRSTIPTSIEIRKHLPTEEITILADPIQMHQMMINICINSFQAMEEAGGLIQVDVSQECVTEQSASSNPDRAAEKCIKIQVRDTGPGINPHIMDRIFDPYFSTKDTSNGSGMGLAVVHGIVLNHGGTIHVQSEPGKGTLFTIRIPIVMQEHKTRFEASKELPRGTERILFVDDEPAIVKMAKLSLERLGYRVETNHNPLKALERFQAEPEAFDLVITDMTMPQMTGVQLSEKLKAVRADVPVILCTGHSALIDEERAARLGISAYVMKPLDRKTTARIIRKVLEAK